MVHLVRISAVMSDFGRVRTKVNYVRFGTGEYTVMVDLVRVICQ